MIRQLIGYGEFVDGTPQERLALYFDMRNWTLEDQAEAQELREKLGLLKQVERFGKTVYEYPTRAERNGKRQRRMSKRQARSMRNSPCPCGSGQKFKQCCLRRHGG